MMTTDSQIYSDIQSKLEFEPLIDHTKIAISVQDGIVTLGGVATSYSEKIMAEHAVKSVTGVKGVANEITVESAPQFMRDDVSIAKTAANSISFDIRLAGETIQIVVEKGWVTLSGTVKWYSQKEVAESCVRRLYGVKGILNQIVVKPTVTPTEVKNKITQELERNALIDAAGIEVETEGSIVNLKGKVRNWSELREAVNAAWSVPGVSRVNNQLRIKPYYS